MKKFLIYVFVVMVTTLTSFGKDYSKYKTDVLISAKNAKEILETNKNSVLIDVRPKAKFAMNNVVGSYSMWRPDMEPKDDRYGEIGGMRASVKEMENELNKMGVNNDTTIVLTGENLDEFRLWWILDLYGAKNIKIVDGGYAALKDTGIKTGFGIGAEEKKGTFKFPEMKEDGENRLASLEDVEKAIKDKEIVLLDTRSAKENKGQTQKKGAFLKGKIPKSEWLEWTAALNDDKTLKSYDELKELYGKYGIHSDSDVVAYCQSGVRSAHTTFVLTELLGCENVKNYDGSWIEWSHEARNGKVEIDKGE